MRRATGPERPLSSGVRIRHVMDNNRPPGEAAPDHARSPRALLNILCPKGLHQQIGATGRDPVLSLARRGHTRNEGNKFEINASTLVRMGRTGDETRFERGKADSPRRSPPDQAALGHPAARRPTARRATAQRGRFSVACISAMLWTTTARPERPRLIMPEAPARCSTSFARRGCTNRSGPRAAIPC